MMICQRVHVQILWLQKAMQTIKRGINVRYLHYYYALLCMEYRPMDLITGSSRFHLIVEYFCEVQCDTDALEGSRTHKNYS